MPQKSFQLHLRPEIEHFLFRSLQNAISDGLGTVFRIGSEKGIWKLLVQKMLYLRPQMELEGLPQHK